MMDHCGITRVLLKTSLLGKENYLRSAIPVINLEEQPEILTSFDTGFTCCKGNNDGRIVASSTIAGTICFFKEKDAELSNQLRVSAQSVWCVDWSGTNQVLCGTSEGDIKVVDAEENKINSRIAVTKSSLVRSLCARDQLISWCAIDGSFGIADIRCGQQVLFQQNHHAVKGLKPCGVSAIVLSEERQGGSRIIATGGSTDGTVKIWDSRKCVSPLQEIKRSKPNQFRGQGVVSLDIDASGDRLLIARRGGEVIISDFRCSSLTANDYLSKNRIFFVSQPMLDIQFAKARFSKDNTITINGRSGCLIFSPDSAADVTLLESPGSAFVGGCEWLKDGSLLAVSGDGFVLKWNYKFHGFKRQRTCTSSMLLVNESPKRHNM